MQKTFGGWDITYVNIADALAGLEKWGVTEQQPRNADQARRMKELEQKNAKLKRLVYSCV